MATAGEVPENINRRLSLELARDLANALMIGGATVFTSLLLADLNLTIQAFVVLWTLFSLILTSQFLIDNRYGSGGSIAASLASGGIFVAFMIVMTIFASWPLRSNSGTWWASLALAFFAFVMGYLGRDWFGISVDVQPQPSARD